MSAPERLWAKPHHNGAVGECWHDARSEAPERPWEFNEYIRADLATSEADALRAENERLREALEPFAQVAVHHAADAPEWGPFDSVQAVISIRSLRAALGDDA